MDGETFGRAQSVGFGNQRGSQHLHPLLAEASHDNAREQCTTSFALGPSHQCVDSQKFDAMLRCWHHTVGSFQHVATKPGLQ